MHWDSNWIVITAIYNYIVRASFCVILTEIKWKYCCTIERPTDVSWTQAPFPSLDLGWFGSVWFGLVTLALLLFLGALTSISGYSYSA